MTNALLSAQMKSNSSRVETSFTSNSVSNESSHHTVNLENHKSNDFPKILEKNAKFRSKYVLRAIRN